MASDDDWIKLDKEDMFEDREEWELVPEVPEHAATVYSAFVASIGSQTKLGVVQTTDLKNCLDKDLGVNTELKSTYEFSLANVNTINKLKLDPENKKLKNILVTVEKMAGEEGEERLLVKVGTCDLSGVGGHSPRIKIIKNLVTQALDQFNRANNTNYTIKDVDISAVVGVRGRASMLVGFFKNTREESGSHMNAYIKTKGEKHLTHWEPRDGPQPFYDDKICAMAIAAMTCLFEYRVRINKVDSSEEATKSILKSGHTKEIFKRFRKSSPETRFDLLGKHIKKMAEKLWPFEPDVAPVSPPSPTP